MRTQHKQMTMGQRISGYGGMMAAIAMLLSPLPAFSLSPDAAAAECRSMFNSVRNPSELSHNREAFVKVQRCIALGIDPPIKIRNDGGREPAGSVPRAQLPSRTCSPFGTCMYTARVNNPKTGSLNHNYGGTGTSINDGPISSSYSAPQFSGHLPKDVPDHLKDGGTIYFYGTTKVKVPKNSMIYEDSSMNYYARKDEISLKNGHVMVPPSDPVGEAIKQKPVQLLQNTKLNFDDGGIVVFPDTFTGKIGSLEIKGGDMIIVDHAEDMMLPKNSKLYPFPQGSHTKGAHIHDKNYVQYKGPSIKTPSEALTVIKDKKYPGVNVWW